MRNIILIFAILIASNSTFAQLTNPGFEQWEGNNPVGWVCLNVPNVIESVEPSQTSHSGNFSARLMISQMFEGSYVYQSIAATNLEDEVEVEVHYAGRSDGTVATLSIVAKIGANVVDGSGIDLEEQSDQFESVTLRWEPMVEDVDSIQVWVALSAEGDPVEGSMLVDDVSLEGVILGVEGNGNIEPVEWELPNLYPNPFNSTTTFNFSLSSISDVDIAVYDLSGRWIATLGQGFYGAGKHRLTWTPEEFSNGIYIIRLNAGGQDYYTRAIYLK